MQATRRQGLTRRRRQRVDTAVALEGARMHVQDRASELDPVIAATAIVHGTMVMNRKLVD